ncbi:vitamin K epoxide reductase family protein [Candidatus Peregrinibacteria bacterium]|nr:vitamin K epoxide reductase family protein [Candidatus Peregrinibacteria bacterium]
MNNNPKLVRPIVNKILIAASVFILINIILSAYLAYEFYFPNEQAFCEINAVWSCLTVAASEYAVFLGIPVAIWGVCFYTLLFVGTIGAVFNFPFWKIYKKLRPGAVLDIMRYLSYFGILFSLYLTYAEIFEINAYCPFCVTQQVLIIIIAALYIWAHKVINKGKKATQVCEFC